MIFPQTYSHYSVLKSILKPAQIIDEIALLLGHDKSKGTVVGLTDLNSMAGIVQFYKAAHDKNMRPALGVTVQFMGGATCVFLAKNKIGYKNILQILSAVNTKDNFFRHPQISFEILNKLDVSGIVCLSGHYGSSIYNHIHTYNDNDIEDDWKQKCMGFLDLLTNKFGKDDFYLQVEPTFDAATLSCYKELISIYKIKYITSNQIHRGNDNNQRYLYDLVRSTKYKCELKSLDIQKNEIRPMFLLQNDYSKELENKIEDYDILQQQVLPVFQTPNSQSPMDYMTELCRLGFKSKIKDIRDPVYTKRIKDELDIFEKAGLADYFLILWDVINWVESQGHRVGIARGSSAGCLVSYLLGITKVDPIKYGLLFSRFFNSGRIGSMPDIDTDFPKIIRDKAIEYTMNKYTREHCGQIATFQTFMGKAALKAVFRAGGNLSFQEMNEITKPIEDKARISDELEMMKKEGLQPSVILWTLKNRSNKLSEYVNLIDDKNMILEGPLAKEFKYAIDLEGIKSAQSKHAAGVVISKDTLKTSCPILYDEKSQEQIVGMEYEDAEQIGIIKYDFLALTTLDKLANINTN